MAVDMKYFTIFDHMCVSYSKSTLVDIITSLTDLTEHFDIGNSNGFVHTAARWKNLELNIRMLTKHKFVSIYKTCIGVMR